MLPVSCFGCTNKLEAHLVSKQLNNQHTHTYESPVGKGPPQYWVGFLPDCRPFVIVLGVVSNSTVRDVNYAIQGLGEIPSAIVAYRGWP